MSIEKGAAKPPKYVTHTPVLYEVWTKWYESLPYPTSDRMEMKPMGERLIPEEFKSNFEGLEEFYQHYIKLTTEV